MRHIVSVVVCLILILGGPALLGAKTDPKAAPNPLKTIQPNQDLETVSADLKENIKDLRHNITSWRKIQGDAKLTPVEKKQWRDRAQNYLQECEAYSDLLAKVDANKLPKSEVTRSFLNDRRIFQQELQYLRQTLQQP